MSNTPPTSDDLSREDDAGIADLLREVGTREEPSQQLTDEVRLAVHAEWQASVRQERRRRQTWMMGMAAGIASIGLATVVMVKFNQSNVAPLVAAATIERIDGSLSIVDGSGRARVASVGEVIAKNDVVQTDASTRVAFKFNGGVSVRLDSNSSLRLRSAENVELVAGGLYVDAPLKPAIASELIVDTHAGAVRHLGTQYQVRTNTNGIDVGVREGRVEVSNVRGVNTAAVGERLRVSLAGDVSHEPLRADDASWRWAVRVAPAFEIENHTLKEFLEWAARESGRRVQFANDAARTAAESVVLKGSIAGLDLDTALTAVLSTTQLRRSPSGDEFIVIEMATSR